MSEAPVSAFAAYKQMRKNAGPKKGNAKGAAKNAKGKATTTINSKGAKGKASPKSKKAPPTANGKPKGKSTVPKSKNVAQSQSDSANTSKNTGKAATSEASKNKAPSKMANGLPESKVKKDEQKAKTNSKSLPKTEKAPEKGSKASNKSSDEEGIKANEVDMLVEQLLGDPTKKLTKAQQKKKKDLEDYLVRQLEMDDMEESDGEEEEEYDSEEGEEEEEEDYTGSFTSDQFSDEYTLNSYSDEEEEEEGEEEEEEETNSRAKPTVPKRKSTTSTETSKASSSAAANGASEPKKSKQEEEPKSMGRKSLPKRLENSVEEKGNKRHTIGGTTTMNTSKSSVISKSIKLEPLSPPSNVVKMNSIKEGEKAFHWVLQPLKVQEFMDKYWEKQICLIKRDQPNYFKHLISFEIIDQMLLKNHVEFTKNIDVTSYKNGVRETLNPEGRAMPPVVWDHYGQGCSVRLLNPQTFLPALFTLNTTLQEYFHCLVGANVYLTPPNSQGFAPHYDDIEAFVLQIEGRKRWKLYKPRTKSDILARYSSENFSQEEIGEPIFEEVLKPGDVLYFPRGSIHQACTEPGYHSLHITLSVYQKQSYADLFERMMPLLLQRAIAENVDLRRGLPLHTWQHAGVAFSDVDTQERAELLQQVGQLMKQCISSVPVAEVMDAAVDQMAKKYQHEALPPEILPAERIRTIFGSRNHTNEQGECVCDYDIELRTNVRLLRQNILRLVKEEDEGEEKIRIYYYLDNSKEYCEYEPNFIEIEPLEAGSIEVLMKSYPEYIGVSQLPLEDDEKKIQMVTALWERGLLMMEKPFK